MHATTVKLDARLIKIANAAKPRDVTLTAFIRSLVLDEARRQQQRAAAVQYEAFLAENPDEMAELEAWEQASLSQPNVRLSPPTTNPKKKRK